MTYTTPAIITQRQALLIALLAMDDSPSRYYPSRAHDIAEALADRLPQRRYDLAEGGQGYDSVWADDLDAALDEARDRFDTTAYAGESTTWVDVRATDAVTGDTQSTTYQVDPDEPDCDCEEHEWRSPYSVLGGLRENPGVTGHGGGAIITQVCACCGKYRITDTWAQNPETGEQGLESVEYRDADDASTEWVEGLE